ncbi:MAG: hypothetical protein MUF64_26735 [Polyangiaceae bacterium]|jgi:hypothetical protein|nr:hypothetical protein [Polyangiaceae bacterium]
MVPFVGVFTSLMVSLAIKIYLAYFCAQGVTSPEFEAWCRGSPLVAAFFCPRAEVGPLVAWLKKRLEGREFVNVEGPFPWTHHRIRLRVEAMDECVVGVRVVWAGVLRGNQTRPPLLAALRELDAAGLGVAELWLHRDLYSDGSELSQEATWRGSPVEGAWFELRSYPELPFWLRRFDGKGPPERRERGAEVVQPVAEPALSL